MIVRHRRVSLKKGLIGVIADTHGLVRPEAITALQGVELIIHGGDIGKPEVLDELSSVAPVHAIRGNNDTGSWAKKLPDILKLRINETKFYVIHNYNDLAIDPCAAGMNAVISGHSHKPSIAKKNGVMLLNPGSAGPRRFKLPTTVARVSIHGIESWPSSRREFRFDKYGLTQRSPIHLVFLLGT